MAPPFAGVESHWLAENEALRLIERRLAALERQADLDRAAGRPTRPRAYRGDDQNPHRRAATASGDGLPDPGGACSLGDAYLAGADLVSAVRQWEAARRVYADIGSAEISMAARRLGGHPRPPVESYARAGSSGAITLPEKSAS